MNALESVKEQLLHEYPDGVPFDSPFSLHQLRQTIPLSDEQIDALKSMMFVRDDGMWLFLEHVADEPICQKILRQSCEWLAIYHFFAIRALYSTLENELRNIAADSDFAAFLWKLFCQRRVDVLARLSKDTYVLLQQSLKNECLSGAATDIAQVIVEHGGMMAQTELAERFPHIGMETMPRILKKYARTIYSTEIDGILCWQVSHALNLPEDFCERATKAIERLIELGLGATLPNVNLALSLDYGVNFQNEYDIVNRRVFRDVLDRHYQGGTPVRWDGGAIRGSFVYETADTEA
jgi:hypothetical protein